MSRRRAQPPVVVVNSGRLDGDTRIGSCSRKNERSSVSLTGCPTGASRGPMLSPSTSTLESNPAISTMRGISGWMTVVISMSS